VLSGRQTRVLTRRAAATVAVALAISCGGSAFAGPSRTRYSRAQAAEDLARLEQPGLVVGEFAIGKNAVVDGDTLRVQGLKTSLRLLNLDTEETFRNQADRRLYEAGWDAYRQAKRRGAGTAVKMATPMGEAASAWAREFFRGVDRVRIERDHPKALRGYYGRYLAYVFARKNGRWVHYNLEAVRAGMSPYFTKYGYSRRFHHEFSAAQKQARAARRGIWDPKGQSYGDYPARLAWWNRRADFIRAFEKDAGSGRDGTLVELSHWDAVKTLEAHVGKTVEILAPIGSIRRGDRGPTRVMLSRQQFKDFPLIYFDKDLFGSSGVEQWKGEFVRARGPVNRYYNQRRKQYELQMIIELPSQVSGPASVRPDQRTGARP
jgi:endonuclease YncB( thermonuclease family)